MNDFEFDSWLRARALPKMAEEYLRRIRHSGPVRRAKSTPLSFSQRFSSLKMRCTLEVESLTEEGPLRYIHEFDDDVLEVYTQASTETVAYKHPATGRLQSYGYTPDGVVIRRQSVEVFECKPRKTLERLVREKPFLWARDGEDYQYLPLSDWCRARDFISRVYYRELFDPIYVQNLKLLYQYRIAGPTPEEMAVGRLISEALKTRHYISLNDCVREQSLSDLSPLLRLIAWNQVQANLDHDLLTDPSQAVVCSSPEVAISLHEQRCSWRTRETAAVTDAEISAAQRRCALDEDEYREALSRVQVADAIQKGRRQAVTRTEERLLQKYRRALDAGEDVLLAVASRVKSRGRRGPRPAVETEALMQEYIKSYVLTAPALSTYAAWNMFKVAAADTGIQKVCYNTFAERVHRVSPEKFALKRAGPRAMVAARRPTCVTTREISPTWPGQRSHIDSTEMDLVVLDRNGIEVLGRPWLTLMVACASLAILAWWIHFRAPSTATSLMTIRDCVRRHGRLTAEMCADGGMENQNTAVELLLPAFGVTKIKRPTYSGRSGAEVESPHGVITRTYVHQLPGNTKNNKMGRSASRKFKGDYHAEIRIDELLTDFEEYVQRSYMTRPLASLGYRTPRAMFESSTTILGAPAERRIPFDERFMQMSSNTLPRLHKLHDKGFTHNEIWYSSPEIFANGRLGSSYELREEPADWSRLYSVIDSRVFECHSNQNQRLRHLSDSARIIESLEVEARQQTVAVLRRDHDEDHARMQLEQAARRQSSPSKKSRTTELLHERDDSIPRTNVDPFAQVAALPPQPVRIRS